MSKRWRIRRATPDGATSVIAGINAICAEGNAFYVNHFVSTPQWTAVLRHPATATDHLLAIIEWDGEFAGAGRIFPGPEHTLFRHVGELGMFVLKPYRRRGLGSRLLAWMLDWAENSELEKITLSVFASNQPAIALYKRFGFVVEGRRRRQFKVGDIYVDELLMARFLDAKE